MGEKMNKRLVLSITCCLISLFSNPNLSAIKDPFFRGAKKSKRIPKKKPQKITIAGIVFVDNEHAAALLECGKESKVVSKGEMFRTFTVTEIEKDYVILSGKKQELKIFFEE